MEKILSVQFAELEKGNASDIAEFFAHYCSFFKEMTYDTVSYEVSIIEALPAAGAGITGLKPGPIQNRKDFERIRWDELIQKYIKNADKKFSALGKAMPAGMKAIGGVANGVFEISEDLVGLQYLAYMQADDPELFRDLYGKIGDMMYAIWDWFLRKHSDNYAVCRFGDDLGYKTSTLIKPITIRQYIIPQYKRIIELIHNYGHPFLWHSCGCIFEIMDDVIDVGIDAKHSNEDVIAPYEKWIELYSGKIGLFGGIDVDLLCRLKPEEIRNVVIDKGIKFRRMAKGYALGSGNSIPDYVPVEGYLAMVSAVKEIRQIEQKKEANKA
jgi:uroporphyrinogen decarboxylase